eukprot:6179236-Pleurochrysis_carterae.AAC.1
MNRSRPEGAALLASGKGLSHNQRRAALLQAAVQPRASGASAQSAAQLPSREPTNASRCEPQRQPPKEPPIEPPIEPPFTPPLETPHVVQRQPVDDRIAAP